MPITRSAKKALRQSIRRRAQNLKRKEAYKSGIKEIRRMIAGNNFNQAKNLLPKIYKALDKAAKTRVIAKNKASRLKSRLARSLFQKQAEK